MASGPPTKRLKQTQLLFAAARNSPSETRRSEPETSDTEAQSGCSNHEDRADFASGERTLCSSVSFASTGKCVISPAGLALELEECAYQPTDAGKLEGIPEQTHGSKTRRFQTAWFQRFPWLHLSTSLKAVVCYQCAKSNQLGLLSLTTKNEDTFVTKGFLNWKRALEKFTDHEKSACHRHAVLQLQQIKSGPVTAKLSSQKAAEQESARTALLSVFGSIRYLARQGLALRGHEESQGNLMQLLQLRSEDSEPLRSWLPRTTKFVSAESQNEILELLSHNVLRAIVKEVQSSHQFGIVVDGTQDCSGQEQESVCIRYVDTQMDVNEVFVGLFSPPDTTGLTLSVVIKDIVLRLGLQLSNVRAQTYDGAANMAGRFNGCQAIICRENPLALFFHCAAHSANLASEHTAESSPLLRDALQNVNELGLLYKRSGKYAHIFDNTSNVYQSPTTLKPICPTRWLCRVRSVTAVLDQYEAVLNSLEEAASGTGEVATKAAGLLDHFSKGVTVLGLKIADVIFGPLEELNRSLQSTSITVSGMLEAAKLVEDQLLQLRTTAVFDKLFDDVSAMVEQHSIDPVTLPRQRRPPTRVTGHGEAYRAQTPQEHFRPAFFACVDTAVNQLSDRLDRNKPGLKTYLSLEKMLTSGEIDAELCEAYPELNKDSLSVQLKMFVNKYNNKTLSAAHNVFRDMVPEVRSLFVDVEQLIRLMLLCPVSSCAAERSFSALRRLKNWLRSTMTQQRLNAVVVCHVNKDIVDSLDIRQLASEFAKRSEIRRGLFGAFDM